MIDCIIMGDSIAFGVHKFRSECVNYSNKGITSGDWYKKYSRKNLKANTVIISLGINDYFKYNTYEKLKEIREKIKSKNVYWIEPNRYTYNLVASLVYRVANEYNDVIIKTDKYESDKVHPTYKGYKELADKTK